MNDSGKRQRIPRRRWHMILAVGLWMAVGVRPLAGESDDLALLAGLRQRRLFELADLYCRQRLADPSLSPKQYGELTVERIRGLAAQALDAAPDARPPLWNAARGAATALLQQQPDHPWALLVRCQDALTVLAQGELARQEAEVGSAQAGDPAPARGWLRQAIRLLQPLADDVADAARRTANQRQEENGPTAEELEALSTNVQLQLARAYRNQALCYAPRSDDYVASLAEAVRRLDAVLRQLPPDNALAWPLRMEQAVCQRLLADDAAARRALVELQQSDAPPAIRLQARAESLRLELTAGDLAAAQKMLAAGREIEGQSSPELDFALLEACLALWRESQSAGDPSSAALWRDRCLDAARFLQQHYGAYWGRRAELLLVNSAPSGSRREDLEILSRSADQLYLQGLYAEAARSYGEAARLAGESGDDAHAFSLQFKAGLVLQQLDRRKEAADRFLALAMSLPTHPQADQAHFQAILNVIHLARSEPQSLSWYEQLLQEHLARWPAGANADRVRLWWGQLLEGRAKWAEAAAAYEAVPPESEQFPLALQAAARCWIRLLEQRQQRGEPTQQEAELAAARLQRWLRREAGTIPDEALQQAALLAAQIRLQYQADGHAAAQEILQQALNRFGDANGSWRSDAALLLIVALAGQTQRRTEASEWLPKLAAPSPDKMLFAMTCLDQLAQAAAGQQKTDLARLQLGVAAMLAAHSGDLDPDQQVRFQQLRAQALADVGRTAEAMAAFAQLAEAHPSNAAVQQGYAELLTVSQDIAAWNLALARWRRIAQASAPGSEPWFRAKYGVALVQWKLGEKAAAAQLIRYLQATTDLENHALRQPFLELLRRCESP